MNSSRQEYYEDEYPPEYYHQARAPYGVEGMPYPYHQQNAMMAQMNMAHGNGMQHYGQGDMRYYDKQNAAAQQGYSEQSETSYDVTTSHSRERRQDGGRRHGRMKDARDVERYSGLYDDGMEPHSSTTRTETERTGGIPTSSYSRSSYTSETSSSESDNLGEGIMSALNDMAGNLKSLGGGIRCTSKGQEKKTKDLKMKMPLPMEGFREVMDALSPKNCAQTYNYDNLDSHVMVGMEDQILGTMDNVMPVYKSLFQSQSESSDESDEYESEHRYEDPRFVAQRQQQQLLEQQAQYEMAVGMPNTTPVPMQIIISDNPSGISSAGSWKLMSPRDRPPPSNLPTSPVHDGFIPSYKKTLQVETAEMKQKEMQSKSTPRDKNIPHVIDLDAADVVECYSDLTNGVRMSAKQKTEKDKSTSNVPAIKTQFSGDEAVDQNKTSFQRNSSKAKLEKERRLKEKQETAKKIEEQREKARLEEEQRQRELEEEQREREAEAALAAKKALEKRKLEDKVEAELQAARAVLQAKKLEEERKRREAEKRAAKQKALEEKKLAEEAKRLEEERRLREAEERAQLELKRIEAEERAKQIALEAKKLEEERRLREAVEKRERELKRIEALERAEQIAAEAKRLEEERLRREAKEKAEEEAQKAKELERERKRIEAETRAAQERLEALRAKKLDEERRQREEDRRHREEERKQREQREQERKARKLKELRDRVEAEAKAEELAAERKRREAEKKATESARKARELEKERKQNRRIHSDEQSRASLYKVQGFDDFCKSVAGSQVDGNDLSDDDTGSYSSDLVDMDDLSQSEDSSVGSSSSDDYSQSQDSYSSGEGSHNMFTDNDAQDADEVRTASSTERLRNHYDFDRQFSSARSVNTVRSVQMKNSKSFSNSKPPLSRPPLSKPPLKPSKYTSDEPIPITATMSTVQTTFDHGTVISGHHSLGRFVKSCDESVVSTYSHQSVISAKPVALPVNTLPREPKKKSKPVPIGRSSIVGTIMSFTLKLSLRVMFTVILFVYTWFKHFMVKSIGGKKEAKLDCKPSKHALQPDRSVMSEEIQERADNRQNQYIGYETHNKGDHYSTTMIIKPPSYMADDNDEVGTCVESIVPDTHYPTMSNGKMSSWKITQKNNDASSVSSRSSFRVLMKNTYTALSRREAEQSNWMDHATIDDEMSYYE